jgi:hypothetical protein
MYIVCADGLPTPTLRRHVRYARRVGQRVVACNYCLDGVGHPPDRLMGGDESFDEPPAPKRVFLDDNDAVADFLDRRWERFRAEKPA